MNKRNDSIQAVIVGCILDEQKQTITVCFQPEQSHLDAFECSFAFKNNGKDREIHDFFKCLPIFTKEGKIDTDFLEGTRVCLSFSETESGQRVVNVKYDTVYYGLDQEEEQSSFYEEGDFENDKQ